MKILLKSATIVDTSSKHHLKKRDVLIEKGIIKKIAVSIKEKVQKEVSLPNLHISQGWFDSGVSFGEPGYEERETLSNGIKVAGLSGFAHVAVQPNTAPATDSKSHIKFIQSKVSMKAVTVHPVGCLSKGGIGEELAELYDMQQEGAIAFYDYKKPVDNPNLLKIALLYAQNFNGLVQSYPSEVKIAPKGIVHEHIQSTMLGLKGIPSLAEELQITRDLYLLEYTGGRLHIPTISTEKSLKLIKESKKKGLSVSCSVSINNLKLTDQALQSFNTDFKLQPPLRTEEDVKALIKGLKDGIIDGVTSDHHPMDVENKRTEFDHAAYGSIGLESCFGALLSLAGLETTILALTGLKEIFGISQTPIKEGELACLSLFNPNAEWQLTEAEIISASKNAALLGHTLKGRAYGVLNNGELLIDA